MIDAKVVNQSVLTQQELKENLHYDPLTGIFVWAKTIGRKIKIGSIAGYLNKSDGYIQIKINGIPYQAHRLAWLYMIGQMPEDLIDHKDTNRANNRFGNLREATNSQNQHNRISPTKHNTTGFLGVSFFKRDSKYVAHICIGNKKKHLGYFSTPEEAHQAYLKAKRELHEFCTI